MAGLGSLITLSAGDPIAGYTATMNFLATPAGQVIVSQLDNVIVDLIKLFHQKNGGTMAITATVTTGTSTT